MNATQTTTHTWSQICGHLRAHGIDLTLLGISEPPPDEAPVEETGDDDGEQAGDDDGENGSEGELRGLFGDDDGDETTDEIEWTNPAEAEARAAADSWIDSLADA